MDDAIALAARIRAGELSPAEAAAQAAAACESADRTLHGLVELFDDLIAAPAPPTARWPACRCSSRYLGSGLAGRRQEMGSRLYAGRVVDETGPLLQNALAAGLVPIGRTTVPELGYAFDTTTADRGSVVATRNPHDPSRTAGGSSGGSAALVAAGAVTIATASDGGGSIRVPAAWCGLVGLKAQRGRFPRPPGGNELTARVSQEGVLTRTVRDTALALDLLQAMPRGGSFMPVARVAAAAAVDDDPGRLRIAVSTGLFGRDGSCEPAIATRVREVADRLDAIGHDVAEVPDAEIMDLGALWAAFLGDWVGSAVELAAAHPDPEPLLTPMVARHYLQAQRRTALDAATSLRANAVVDALLRAVPGALRRAADPRHADLRTRRRRRLLAAAATSRWRRGSPASATPAGTRCRSTSGAPAIAIPTGPGPDGMPIGVQLGGGFGGEVRLLQVARQLEVTAS